MAGQSGGGGGGDSAARGCIRVFVQKIMMGVQRLHTVSFSSFVIQAKVDRKRALVFGSSAHRIACHLVKTF